MYTSFKCISTIGHLIFTNLFLYLLVEVLHRKSNSFYNSVYSDRFSLLSWFIISSTVCLNYLIIDGNWLVFETNFLVHIFEKTSKLVCSLMGASLILYWSFIKCSNNQISTTEFNWSFEMNKKCVHLILWSN